MWGEEDGAGAKYSTRGAPKPDISNESVKNRDTDVENGHVDTELRKWSGGQTGRLGLTYIHYHV